MRAPAIAAALRGAAPGTLVVGTVVGEEPAVVLGAPVTVPLPVELEAPVVAVVMVVLASDVLEEPDPLVVVALSELVLVWVAEAWEEAAEEEEESLLPSPPTTLMLCQFPDWSP